MKPLILLLLGGLLCCAAISAEGADSAMDLGFIQFTLPAGYVHHAFNGIDSLVGEITIPGKPYKIEYDSFNWSEQTGEFCHPHKDTARSTFFDEAVEGTPVPCRILASTFPNNPKVIAVTFEVKGVGDVFWIDIHDKSQVQDAVNSLKAIKIVKVADLPK